MIIECPFRYRGRSFMAQIWKPQEKSVYLDWIIRIKQEAWNQLNDWEQSFIISLYERLSFQRTNLTHGQADKLETIYSEKTK